MHSHGDPRYRSRPWANHSCRSVTKVDGRPTAADVRLIRTRFQGTLSCTGPPEKVSIQHWRVKGGATVIWTFISAIYTFSAIRQQANDGKSSVSFRQTPAAETRARSHGV